MDLIEKLVQYKDLREDEFLYLLNNQDDFSEKLFKESRKITNKYFSNKIYVRGLLEISNICKNNCYYCGIRRDNKNVKRYRMSKESILESVKFASDLGFKTFVLQGGEDSYFSDDILSDILKNIKKISPNCAITLSVGEREYNSYRILKESGADRFLLRHETANEDLYKKLHPSDMSFSHRMKSLRYLKKLDYQTGAGFMVGAPFQKYEDLVMDLKFLRNLNPEMIGIGPFIPQHDTKFSQEKNGSVDLTIYLLSILRIMFPNANLPATTALSTLSEGAREKAIKVGANVFMPNISPSFAKENYNLYDNKLYTNMECAENLEALKSNFKKIGYEIVMDKGDFIPIV